MKDDLLIKRIRAGDEDAAEEPLRDNPAPPPQARDPAARLHTGSRCAAARHTA